MAEKLPETVQKVEPTLEDAYVYLVGEGGEAAMTVWRDLRVEWMRLFRSKGTWLALLAASAAPLVGYGLYQPAGGGTTAALVLLNPMLAGALGGALAFAVLTLSEMNRVKKGEWDL